jgi:hypothetical protein
MSPVRAGLRIRVGQYNIYILSELEFLTSDITRIWEKIV